MVNVVDFNASFSSSPQADRAGQGEQRTPAVHAAQAAELNAEAIQRKLRIAGEADEVDSHHVDTGSRNSDTKLKGRKRKPDREKRKGRKSRNGGSIIDIEI